MAPIRLYNLKTKKEFREFFLFSSNVGAITVFHVSEIKTIKTAQVVPYAPVQAY